MRYREQRRRLDALETQQRDAARRWLESLSDAELEALIAAGERDPEFEAAVTVLSDADLERACAGDLDRDDIVRLYRRAQGRTL